MAEGVPTVATIGTFDGVHRGHRRILEQLLQIANQHGLKPVVITFDPHPQEVLKTKHPDIQILTDTDEKLTIFKGMDIAGVAAIDFTLELAGLSPRMFVEEVFIKRLQTKWVVIGYDHAFGKDREGDRDNLSTLSKEFDYRITVVEPVKYNNTIISSTKIRKALYVGNVEAAAQFLGRPYSITGKVVSGAHRGRNLDMPTANVYPRHPRKLMPGDGVYAGHVRVDSQVYLSAISLGDRPTFQSHDRVLEAHLIDFQGDLYDRTLTVEFTKKLRDQITFSSHQELINQMKADVEAIRDKASVPKPTV